jgi:Flp pilus assembly protein TadG
MAMLKYVENLLGFKKFLNDEKGSMLILMSLLFFNILLVSVSLAVDVGRAYLTRTAMGGASDAAAIAAARVNDPSNISEITRQARMFFTSNLPEVNTPYGITYNYNDNVSVVVTAQDTVRVNTFDFVVPVYFGFNTQEGSDYELQIASNTEVGFAEASLVPIDYYLVVDVSYSMRRDDIADASSRIDATQKAAGRLAEAVFDEAIKINNSDPTPYRMGIISYASGLRSKSTMFDNSGDVKGFVNALAPVPEPNGYTCGACGMRGAQEMILANRRPGAIQIVIFMTDGIFNTVDDGDGSSRNSRSYPHYYAPEMWDCPITNVTAPYYNRTFTSLPRPPAGPYPATPASFPADYFPSRNDGNAGRIVETVIENATGGSWPYDLDGYLSYTDACSVSHAQLATRCSNIKSMADAPQIWTIAFGEDYRENAAGEVVVLNNLVMLHCASDFLKYRQAESGTGLEDIFLQIVEQIRSIRIVK